jgi:hypothetical protein
MLVDGRGVGVAPCELDAELDSDAAGEAEADADPESDGVSDPVGAADGREAAGPAQAVTTRAPTTQMTPPDNRAVAARLTGLMRPWCHRPAQSPRDLRSYRSRRRRGVLLTR